MSPRLEHLYTDTFRDADTTALREHLQQKNSVVLIGMKRVGISNFLRFFLSRVDLTQNTCIVVDLNHLVEKSLFAFWMLTLKRIVDAIDSGPFPVSIKKQSRDAFIQSIQLSDPFFTLESIHKLVGLIADHDVFITIFFLRFDRLRDAMTNEFFANIRGLQDSGHLSYVFTSFRPLYEIAPSVFSRSSLPGFCEEMYLRPALPADMQTILSSFQDRYLSTLDEKTAQIVLSLSGGHVQYLHLILIKLKNKEIASEYLKDQKTLLQFLKQDEEIRYLSEELFESLLPQEQEVMLHAADPLSPQVQQSNKYLWETGMLLSPTARKVFSLLFESYLDDRSAPVKRLPHEFTKKEHLLFSTLHSHENELVGRDAIILAVWRDEAEYGVSDWSIDRLVSRVRAKLKRQHSEYQIVTVIERGYKLTRSQ